MLSVLGTAYAMENQEGHEEQDPTTVAIRRGSNSKQKEIVITAEEVSRKFSALPKKKLGGSLLYNIGIGNPSKDYVEVGAAALMVTNFIAEKLGEVGRELANTESNLSHTAIGMNKTSEQMRGSAEIFAQAAATARALEEEQRRASELAQELNRLKFQQQALELALDEEQEKTHGLLTAKNTAERDLLLKQKRVETLESLNEEKARIIEQLQHVEQEKAKLEKSKNRLESLLKKKLHLEDSVEEIDLERLEQLIAEQEEHVRKELKDLRNLIEEEKRKEFELQQQIVRLGEEKIRNERRIQELTHTIYLSENPYEYLARLINLPAAEFSDENLACEIMVIVHREKKDLDELTPSADKKRLIELLTDRTRPYQRVYDDYNRRRSVKIIPGGENDQAYRGRDRELGNVFIKGGFGFGGNPLDMNACRYKGSQFEKNANSFMSGIK